MLPSLTKNQKTVLAISLLAIIAIGLSIFKYGGQLKNSKQTETKQPGISQESSQEIIKYLNEHPEVVSNWMLNHAQLMSETLKKIEIMNSDQKYQEFQKYIYLGENYDVSKPIVFEFYNFGCSVCQNAFRVLKELPELKSYNVALLHIHSEKYPYASLLAQVVEALAVLDKKRVLPFIEAVFEVQGQFETEEFNVVLTQIFQKLDIDERESQKIWETIKEQKLYDKLVVYRNLADQNDITSTPSFVIKGEVYKGLPPIQIFKNILNHK